MLFNLENCKVMHIGYGNDLAPYYMSNKLLSVVNEELDLGVIVQDDLKSTKQCAVL